MRYFDTIVSLLITLAIVISSLSALLTPTGGVTVPDEYKYPDDSAVITRDAMADTYACTDMLGRTLSLNDSTGDVREDRFVGMFYWTWHTHQSPGTSKICNVTKILESNPDISHDLNAEEWGPLYMPHFWNEPVYGYYDTDDEWVLRRQAEMFAAAGVDVLIFDNTNGTLTFKESYDALFRVFAQARKDGVATPQIAFLLPFASGDNTNTQLRKLYEDIYSQGRYQELWFYWEGKPLIMAHPDELDKKDGTDSDILNFFTFRPGIPFYEKSNEEMKGSNAIERARNKNTYWNWLSVYPQSVTYNRDGTAEEMAVGVAQNHSAELGLTAMNGTNVFGRTHTSNGYDTSENAVLKGANFAEQFEYALTVDPEFIFITGWNEWVAGRHEEWQGVTNAFPDEFNDEFSRDIEPSTGKLKDAYYYQLVDFIRRYKGTRPADTDTKDTTINLTNGFADWDKVDKTYYAYVGNTFDRDDVGYAGIHYTDNSGRNDITAAKTVSDAENVYFYVECADNITMPSKNWMRLLLDTGDSGNSWEGFEFIINRLSPSKSTVSVEASLGGWNWKKIGDAQYHLEGNMLEICVPKALLGIKTDSFNINFKWTDNTLSDGDIMDFYTLGDTAPLGRFTYRYIKEADAQ